MPDFLSLARIIMLANIRPTSTTVEPPNSGTPRTCVVFSVVVDSVDVVGVIVMTTVDVCSLERDVVVSVNVSDGVVAEEVDDVVLDVVVGKEVVLV